MTIKELRNAIEKIQSPVVKKAFVEMMDKSDAKSRKKIARVIGSFENRVKNDLNYKAKAIASYIRFNMEDFHSEHLSDAQMKKLNPIIRNAIYTFLKDEENNNIISMMGVCGLNIAPYWEDCVYLKRMHTGEEI